MTAPLRIKHDALLAAVVLSALAAFATPIKPNLEKILQQQEQQPRHFEPARAGWNGPEMIRPQDASPNPIYEAYGPASTVRAIRSSLRAAATPDPVALAAIGMLIIMWRIVRRLRYEREQVVANNSATHVQRDVQRKAA